ncbi:MAG: hypothetical protein GC157_13685 [Frankiales bacterium]|nr:hypothetical protein [Frankiales bacterium]
MGIGFSILLLAAGAILAFAVDATVAGVDIHTVGWILMGAGVLGLIWSLILVSRRREVVVEPRHSVADTVVTRRPVADEPVAVDEVRNPDGL